MWNAISLVQELNSYRRVHIHGFAFGAARLVQRLCLLIRNWVMRRLRRLRWQRVLLDVWGIVFVGLTKDMLQLYELNFGCHREFRVWYLGEYAFSPLKWPRGKMGARCRERDYASDRHSQFWGDIKLCLYEACWMYLIYIQLGFLARNP